jgi:SAM-dependent methyltransferase
MISDALWDRLACPVCLEDSAGRASGPLDDETYKARLRAGDDKTRLERREDTLHCPSCAADYAVRRDVGYVDLIPKQSVGEITQYADHEFHERLGVIDAPPLLSARVKADMMRRMLAFEGDSVHGSNDEAPEVLDLGSGAGKLALFTASCGAHATGVDVAPFFLPRAAREIDLVLGDLRRLPFRRGAFPFAYSLDVLEHLDEAGVKDVLREACHAVGSRGRLFVYTHAMESSKIASFQRAVNRFARRLGERGLIDHEREAMRKSDHINAIRSHEHFDELCAEAGLRVTQRRYYNVVFKAVVEDVLLRLFEQRKRRKKARPRGPSHDALRGAEHEHGNDDAPKPNAVPSIGAPSPPGWQLAIGGVLSWLLKLDVVLFSGIRTGPFFGLLEPIRSKDTTKPRT